MADPLLEGQFPTRCLYQALAIAAMCIQEKPDMRPAIAEVVIAFNFLASQEYYPKTGRSPEHDCKKEKFSAVSSSERGQPSGLH